MNYEKLYNILIESAKQKYNERRILKKNKSIYYEKHHIIPKCMGGNNLLYENVILLTAREHFICHKLLIKFVPEKYKSKLIYALWGMCNQINGNLQRNYKITNRTYESIKLKHCEEISIIQKSRMKKYINSLTIEERKQKFGSIGFKNGMYGKRHSEETKNKISENNKMYYKTHSSAMLGRKGNEHPAWRRKKSEEEKKKISDGNKGNNNGMYGKRHSEETKNKISEKLKGRILNPLTNVKIKCPFCDKIGIHSNMKRWHFDNCKFKK